MKKTFIISLLIAIPFVSFGAVSVRAGTVRVSTPRASSVRTSTPRPVTLRPVKTVRPTKQVIRENTTSNNVTSYNPFSGNFFMWYWLFGTAYHRTITATSTQLKK